MRNARRNELKQRIVEEEDGRVSPTRKIRWTRVGLGKNAGWYGG